jgi:nucleoid-associated protein YgaU
MSADVNKTYIVQPYDTLMAISNMFYANPAFWRVIAQANNINNPVAGLKAGMTLVIPPLT